MPLKCRESTLHGLRYALSVHDFDNVMAYCSPGKALSGGRTSRPLLVTGQTPAQCLVNRPSKDVVLPFYSLSYMKPLAVYPVVFETPSHVGIKSSQPNL